MDTSAIQVACNMAKLLFVILGVTVLSQHTGAMPVSDEQNAILQLLSSENSDPYQQRRVFQQYLQDLQKDSYNPDIVASPEKRLKQGWKIAYGKRRRNNGWSIHYGKRNAMPLESEDNIKGEFPAGDSYPVDLLFPFYPQVSKRQQGWYIAYG